MVKPSANPDSVAPARAGVAIGGSSTTAKWLSVGRAGQGCAGEAGRIIAFQRARGIEPLAVVRRMQREQVDEVICGVEVIARRIIRVLFRTWSRRWMRSTPIDRPFFGVYIPATSQPPATQRSLIGPDDRLYPAAWSSSTPATRAIRALQPARSSARWLVVGAVQRGAEAVRLMRLPDRRNRLNLRRSNQGREATSRFARRPQPRARIVRRRATGSSSARRSVVFFTWRRSWNVAHFEKSR